MTRYLSECNMEHSKRGEISENVEKLHFLQIFESLRVSSCRHSLTLREHKKANRVIMRVHGDRFIVSQHNKGTQCIHSMYSKVVPLSHSVTVSILSTEIDSVLWSSSMSSALSRCTMTLHHDPYTVNQHAVSQHAVTQSPESNKRRFKQFLIRN